MGRQQDETGILASRPAPSGRNSQHWTFILLDERDALSRLVGLCTTGQMMRDPALAVVILWGHASLFYEVIAGRAGTDTQLDASREGLGSSLCPGFEGDRVRSLLEYPASVTTTLVAGFGLQE